MMQRNTLTPAERMARRQQAKEKRAAKKEATRAAGMTSENKPMPTALLAEYKALRYDYRLVSQQHRRTVQDAAVDIRRKQARVMEDLLAIGRRLVEVKDLLPHGQFGRWIEDEFELSERVAQGMMNAAKVYSDEAKARRVALLSDGALYLLVAPSTPEAAREQVETIIERTGKAPKRAEVQQIIEAAKAKRVSLLRDEIKAKLGEPAPRMIEMKAETPTVAEPPEPVHTAWLEGAEYAAATQQQKPLVPVMPVDLATAGYRLDSNKRGLWRWEQDKVWGGSRGNWVDDPAEAIDEARADFGERAAKALPAEPAIDGEYTVVAPTLTLAEWWAMMPEGEMTLRDWLLIFQTAKVGATYVREGRPALNLSVGNFLVPVSQLIHAIEKELKK